LDDSFKQNGQNQPTNNSRAAGTLLTCLLTSLHTELLTKPDWQWCVCVCVCVCVCIFVFLSLSNHLSWRVCNLMTFFFWFSLLFFHKTNHLLTTQLTRYTTIPIYCHPFVKHWVGFCSVVGGHILHEVFFPPVWRFPTDLCNTLHNTLQISKRSAWYPTYTLHIFNRSA
jgi:hypothetical protein